MQLRNDQRSFHSRSNNTTSNCSQHIIQFKIVDNQESIEFKSTNNIKPLFLHMSEVCIGSSSITIYIYIYILQKDNRCNSTMKFTLVFADQFNILTNYLGAIYLLTDAPGHFLCLRGANNLDFVPKRISLTPPISNFGIKYCTALHGGSMTNLKIRH